MTEPRRDEEFERKYMETFTPFEETVTGAAPAGLLREALKRTGWWPDLDDEDYEPLAHQLSAALAATGDSGGRQAPCDDEQLRSAFMKGVESAEEARAMKEAGDFEGPLDLLLAAESVRDTLAVGHQPTIDQYDALNAAVNKRTLVKP